MNYFLIQSSRFDTLLSQGYPFVGLLFTGFILTADGPKVLEYNVRFGDPETEALMLLLDDDLAKIMLVRELPTFLFGSDTSIGMC